MKIAFRMASTVLEDIGRMLTPAAAPEAPAPPKQPEVAQEAPPEAPAAPPKQPAAPPEAPAAEEPPKEPAPPEPEVEEAPKEAEPEAPAKKSKKERQIPIPKDSSSFFRARAKNLKMFKFTSDGNLQVPEMRGEPAKVIEIPYYRSATPEEVLEEEAKALEEIQAVEREFDETYKLLRRAIVEWRTTGFSADVLKMQRDLQRLDAQRTNLRSPLRWTKTFKNLSINRILLTEFYEQRKLGYPVEALCLRSLPYEKTVIADGFIKPLPKKEEEEVSEDEEEFVIFSSPTDPDHGSLSPDTMVEFIYNSTKYNCLLQAYEGERLTMLGRQDVRPVLLKSRSPRQMRVITSRVVGQVESPRELLINIIKSLISQHPRFADDLRLTGTATLVFAEVKDGVLGVGMGVADPQITERSAWKGKNFLGQAWTAVRASLPEAKAEAEAEEAQAEDVQAEEAQAQGGYTEHGKTLQEAKEQRTKVLQGKYRRNF